MMPDNSPFWLAIAIAAFAGAVIWDLIKGVVGNLLTPPTERGINLALTKYRANKAIKSVVDAKKRIQQLNRTVVFAEQHFERKVELIPYLLYLTTEPLRYGFYLISCVIIAFFATALLANAYILVLLSLL